MTRYPDRISGHRLRDNYLISEHKYGRISRFSGYRASGYQHLTIAYLTIIILVKFKKNCYIIHNEKPTKYCRRKNEQAEDVLP
jgi:hypothetical protein